MKTVPNEIRSAIQKAYRILMEKGGKRRSGQQKAIGEIANTISNAKRNDEVGDGSRMLAVQAPTGSGKSFAYGLGAIPVALAAGLKTVISTGTVQLQDQLFDKDLKVMAQVFPEIKAVLVKGRGRYSCTIRLNNIAQGDGIGKKPEVRELAIQLSRDFQDGIWNGDVDNLSRQPDAGVWSNFTTDSNGCSGKKCSKHSGCPFQVARGEVESANVLVVNHDMLIADASSGNHILPRTDNSVLIIDEAHEFPAKALSSLEGRSALEESKRWVMRATKVLASLRANAGNGNLKNMAGDATDALSALGGCLNEATMAIEATGKVTNVRDPSKPIRFPMGKLPKWLGEVASMCKDASKNCQVTLDSLIEILKGEDTVVQSAKMQEQFLGELGKICSHLESIQTVWILMNTATSDGAPVAKWVEIDEEKSDLHVCASPVGVGEFLHNILWSKCAASVHLSATLTSVGGFNQYLCESGLGRTKGVRTLDVETPFDFDRQATLSVPKGIASPKDAEKHTHDLIVNVKAMLSQQKTGEGTLIVFSSWKQLKEVADAMTPELKEFMLVQGDGLSKREIIQRHKTAVDAGFKSAIFGTASFEQGVDLPGKYVTLVVIAKLQFQVPTDPIAEAHKEYLESLGRSYFDEVVIPHTARRLAQTAGRLIRSEEDYGRIVIADLRLTSTKYGRTMLKALPAYRQDHDWTPDFSEVSIKNIAQTGIQSNPW